MFLVADPKLGGVLCR